MKKIYLIQQFIIRNGFEIPISRPCVFFGRFAKKKANQGFEKYNKGLGYKEIDHSDFNLRLLKDGDYYVEMYCLEHSAFIFDCRTNN